MKQLQQVDMEYNSSSYKEISYIKSNIIQELKSKKTERATFIRLHFQLLLMNLYRLNVQNPSKFIKSSNKTLGYFLTFQKLFKQSIHETKNIHEYAQELGITAIHLNRICKNLVPKTALPIVHYALIIEIKKYLLSTNNSLSEIAYFFNFNEPSHFTKFFKKKTGMTPRDY